MWKTLDGFSGQMRRIANILPGEIAQIHCSASVLLFLRRPQVPAGLPEVSFPERRGGLRLGGGIRGLVQPPASPQRHPVRDAVPAPQRRSRCDQPIPRQRLRASPSSSSAPLEPQHALLETTGGGVDQSTATRKRHHCRYLGESRLTGSTRIIFPGSYRGQHLKRSQHYQLFFLARQ